MAQVNGAGSTELSCGHGASTARNDVRRCRFAVLSHIRGLILALVFAGPVVCAETRIEEVPGQSLFSFDFAQATDFSGITWAGGSDYYVVSDKVIGVFPLRIAIDPSTGKVLDAKFGKMLRVRTRLADFEGVAFVPEERRAYVSAEQGNGILGFDIATGISTPVSIPPVFTRSRRNKGLECLTRDPKSGAFWIANEEAIEGDGPVSGPGAGTLVRLQKFDRRFKPLAQFAWRTEPSKIRLSGSGTGVSDLAALPNGELLVLERVASATGLSAKVFSVRTREASDVSRIFRLENAEFMLAGKNLLFERPTFLLNFEGIALGPPLEGGWRSLLLLADSGGGAAHSIMPLRIRWDLKK